MTTSIEIVNLKCEGCANSIKKGVQAIIGVSNVAVNLETNIVKVATDKEETLTKVKQKLASMGYPEVGSANTIIHKAKSFVSCATGKMSKED